MPKINIQAKLIEWFHHNKRDLPWRKERDWYSVWISEVMLQQTQVEQVVPYYQRFKTKFSGLKTLAGASEEEILKIWEGLGYYSRARHLHQAAKIILECYDGKLPTDKKQIQKLPGFGPYTSNAVLSLAFNQPFGVVDGNIKRVIARLYALKDDIRKPATHRKIQEIMDQLVPQLASRDFNEAMMELGALICLPTNPDCENCPISENCTAHQNNLTGILPIKSQKKKIPLVQSAALVIRYHNYLVVAKRPTGAMLSGLWEFPTFRLSAQELIADVNNTSLKKHFYYHGNIQDIGEPVSHSYTHFNLKLYPIMVKSTKRIFKSDFYADHRWVKMNKIKKLPLHKAMWKLIDIIG